MNYPFLKYMLCCWALGMTLSGNTQTSQPATFLNHQDTIFITLGNKLEKFVEHTVKPKQTIYSLARFYGMRTNDLVDYNLDLGKQIASIGSVLRIPIPNSSIIRFKGSDFQPHNYIPIVYRVRQGETFYRIARKYFRMPVDSLQTRNNITGYALQEGQLLHIGWMHVAGVPDDKQVYANSTFKTNFILQESFSGNKNGKLRTETGVAFWQKDAGLAKGLYALHNKAKIGSKIAVSNPMNGKTVFVKVIGRIPSDSYREVVVLSAEAAKYVGAKDARFFVEVRYKR